MRGEQYLTKSKQYEAIHRMGSSWPSDLVILRALPNDMELSRYGLSVGRRVGTAVRRNRVKRLLREIMREVPFQKGWDIVFIARVPAAQADYLTLRETVRGLLKKAGLVMGKYEEARPGTD